MFIPAMLSCYHWHWAILTFQGLRCHNLVCSFGIQRMYLKPFGWIKIATEEQSKRKSQNLIWNLCFPYSDSKLLDFELLDYSKLFFQRSGLPGGLDFVYLFSLSLSLSVFTYFSFLPFLSLFPFISFSLSLVFCLHFRFFRLYLSSIRHLEFQLCKYFFYLLKK